MSAPRSLSNRFCCCGVSMGKDVEVTAVEVLLTTRLGNSSESAVKEDELIEDSTMTELVARLAVSNKRSTPEREYTSPQDATVEDRQIYWNRNYLK